MTLINFCYSLSWCDCLWLWYSLFISINSHCLLRITFTSIQNNDCLFALRWSYMSWMQVQCMHDSYSCLCLYVYMRIMSNAYNHIYHIIFLKYSIFTTNRILISHYTLQFLLINLNVVVTCDARKHRNRQDVRAEWMNTLHRNDYIW